MNAPRPLVPPEVRACARSLGRLPFGFGPRFFLTLLFGFLWLVPAWWVPQLIAALFLWDFRAIVAFVGDLLRLPAPSQLEARRVWQHAPSLAASCDVALLVRNFGRAALPCLLIDETPVSFRTSPPSLEFIVGAGDHPRTPYPILPPEPPHLRLNLPFPRYQSHPPF